MPRCQLPFLDPILNIFLQLQQPDRVRHCCTIFAGAFRHRFLRQVKLMHQTVKRTRLLDGIQVFALNVLNQRHFQRQLVGHLPDDRRHAAQRSALRRPPAPLSGDELKPVANWPNDKRLNDSTRANRSSQLIECLFAKPSARLVRAWIDEVDINFLRTRQRTPGPRRWRYQRGCWRRCATTSNHGCSRWWHCGSSWGLRLPYERSESPPQRVSRQWL